MILGYQTPAAFAAVARASLRDPAGAPRSEARDNALDASPDHDRLANGTIMIQIHAAEGPT
jgi:hypothetical protein